jgi:hypothetical protein
LFHTPFVHVTTEPTRKVPLIVGAAVLTGGAMTGPTLELVAPAPAPPAFDPVTVTSM